MIAKRPSDLDWRSGPLPEPQENLVVLAWIAGDLSNILCKLMPSHALGAGTVRWANEAHVPAEKLGEVVWYAVLRDEPYRGYVKLAERDPNSLPQLVDRLSVAGGCLVAVDDVGQGDVLQAQGRGDVHTNPRGWRFVRLPAEWLQRHLRSARGADATGVCT